MPTTLIVEPNPAGHRLQAVANVARTALSSGDVVVLTSVGASAREEYATFLADLPIAVEEQFAGSTVTTPELAGAIRAVCMRRTITQVVVMDGDRALKTWWYVARRALRRLRPRPSIAFFLTSWPARLERGGLSDTYFLKVRVAKSGLVLLARLTGTLDHCAGFAGRDETSPGWLVKRARDPAICEAHSRDRTALRRELSLPEDRRLVGIFGGINIRKAPELALDAVLAAGADADLLLAGPVDDRTRAWLADLPPRSRDRVIVRDGFLSNEALDKHLAASDVVLLLMRLEGPSGIMGKALSADVAVVTADSKTRARELHALHHGAATEATVPDLAGGLRRVLDGTQASDPPSVELPTADTFGATVLGLPDADPAMRVSPAPPSIHIRRIATRLRSRAR